MSSHIDDNNDINDDLDSDLNSDSDSDSDLDLDADVDADADAADISDDEDQKIIFEETETIEETEIFAEDEGFENSGAIFLKEEADPEGFLPEVSEVEERALDDEFEGVLSDLGIGSAGESLSKAVQLPLELEGTELENFESATIEERMDVNDAQLESIVESILFASDRPVSLASIKMVFKGTNVRSDRIRKAIDRLTVEYAGAHRGVALTEVTGGYQIRTKLENLDFLRRTLKTRAFKLSGPALEVLAIAAYKQPVVKSEIDEIRGVESGHLLRALMEKGLVNFEGKSDLPGRPMQYATTKKFLEIFGLRNLKELPTLSEMDQLIPDGIGDEDEPEKQTLSSITDSMSEGVESQYSIGEEELLKIEEQLSDISTSSDFFEEEKRRQREKRDQERAQNIREAVVMGEPVTTRDQNWLKKFDEAVLLGKTLVQVEEEAALAREAQNKQEFIERQKQKQVEAEALEMAESAAVPEKLEILSQEIRMESLVGVGLAQDLVGDDELLQFEGQIEANEDALQNRDQDRDFHDDDSLDDEELEDELPFYEEADEDGEGENHL